MTLPPNRIEAHDRRRAAVHEAGHQVMTDRLRVLRGEAEIFPNPDSSAWSGLEKKRWIGHINVYPLVVSQNGTKKATSQTMRLVGVAGFVAEMAWSKKDKYVLVDTIYDPAAMSDSDWILTGCEPGRPTDKLIKNALDVYRLFERPHGALFKGLCAAARRLILDARLA